MAPINSSDPDSVVAKVQTFVEENKKVVLGAAVVAAVGLGCIIYASSRPGGPDKGGGTKSTKDARKDKKAGKKPKSGRRVDQPDGPILEERSPDSRLTSAQIQALSTEERLTRAGEFKSSGNSAYSARKFELAVDYYTQAIAVSPKPQAVFYSNRAACYANYKPPEYEHVIEDCTSALALDPKYLKALNRRGTALEALGRLHEALRDFTALTLLEQFKNDTVAASVERVVSRIATEEAQVVLRERKPRLPNASFVTAYVSAFRPRAPVTLPQNPTVGDKKLLEAQEALAETKYIRAQELVNEALDSGISPSWREGQAEALNLRGTFRFLMGDGGGAKADFMASTGAWPALVQSWVKLASVYMEQTDLESSFACLESAITQDPSDPDIYYHRGQIFFILTDFQKALEDYKKSTELDPTFVFSHVQTAVTYYKMEQVDESLGTFRQALIAFPGRSEPYNYYGEILMDQQRYTEAMEKFDRAIEIERNANPPANPLPFVNKALTIVQYGQDPPAAVALCREALQIDPELDAAVATLAQLSLQLGNVEEAAELFKRHASIARTEAELIQAISWEQSSRAQIEFAKNYPDQAPHLPTLFQTIAAMADAQNRGLAQ